jgi:rubredoxin
LTAQPDSITLLNDPTEGEAAEGIAPGSIFMAVPRERRRS